MATARCSMSIARLPDERFRVIETGEALALPRLVTGSRACCRCRGVSSSRPRTRAPGLGPCALRLDAMHRRCCSLASVA